MTKKKKILSIVSLTLVAIFLVTGIITAIIINSINANSREQVLNYYNSQLAKYEKLSTTANTEKFTVNSALAYKNDCYSSDYLMNIYSKTGTINVQMKINSIGKLYLLEFNDPSNREFFNQRYVMQLGTNNSFQTIYQIENGKIIATHPSTQASFFNLCDKLQKFIPDNYCGKGTYKTHKVYTDSSNNNTFMLYGENTTLLFNNNYYFEKNGDTLVRIKEKNGKYLFKIPGDIK